jgi:hypothetical protein
VVVTHEPDQRQQVDPASFTGARQCEHADIPLEMTLESYRRDMASGPDRDTRPRSRRTLVSRLRRSGRQR